MPALVKAAAGGGGRGMRIVRSPADLPAAVEAAAREAEAAFGDGTVFVEPFIERGRHVEVQILGDAHGDVVHFGERECSIQRRNQKIVEEAPSAGISEAVRQELCTGAVLLARSVSYQNAGTVEFLVGEDGAITFLEVNTRLQVEHPVTEAVTGVDLVELQLRVAAGEPLPLRQEDVTFDGHAIEVRLVAEDPAAGWLPSTGTLSRFEIGEGVRVDSGFSRSAEVSPDYDSLLAKIIAHAPTRRLASKQLRRALRGSQVTGVCTNLGLLQAILGEPDFLAARTPVAYLDDHPELLRGGEPDGPTNRALLVAAVLSLEERNRAASPTSFAPSGWRNLRTQGQRVVLAKGDESFHVEYVTEGDETTVLFGEWPRAREDGSLSADDRERSRVRLLHRHGERLALEVDGRRSVVEVHVNGEAICTSSSRGALVWTEQARFTEHEAVLDGSGPICPLPGTVIALSVGTGDRVRDGDVLMIVEAMKMEHRITAAFDATVTAVHFGVGDRVDAGDLLVALERATDG